MALIKKETPKTTTSTHAGGKVALKFKEGTKNATPLKVGSSSSDVQFARRKQMAEGVAKSDWVGSKSKHNPALSQSTRIANMQAEAKIVLKKKK
jgi:hypothetical protein